MFDLNESVRIAPNTRGIPQNQQAQPAREFPFWDNESLLAYARRTCHTSVEEFRELLLAECRKHKKGKAVCE